MRIFLAGATGVLGRRLIAQFRGRGHEVVGLARSLGNESTIAVLGGTPRRGDLYDVESIAQAAEGADVVVRAATAIPRGARFRPRDWIANDRIRREGTRALTEAAARVHARLYLQEGIVWVAQPETGAPFDETSPVAPRLWYGSAADAESIARDAGRRHGFEVATLRFGMFYGSDAAQTRLMGDALRRRRLPILGPGDAAWSCIHLDDAASAMVAAAEAGGSGLWHVVDDRVVTMAEFFRTFAAVLEAPEPRRVPVSLAKLLIGRSTVSFLTASTRTTNARIRRDLGWSPRFPTIWEGLLEVAEAWKADGFPSPQGAGR
ncbi:MAG TPA: NAD-dependent epimerase/dehydratase family protein [Thermoplasmata archaeon]|jgi:nucleoside-diphosphate-sugar epimerase|nr:NAD-dependent epimerase/dehydratase family protein [Thermoplasmata archaeon]